MFLMFIPALLFHSIAKINFDLMAHIYCFTDEATGG